MSVREPLEDANASEVVALPEGLKVLSEGGLALLASTPDTMKFTQRLADFADVDSCPSSAEHLQQLLPEEAAASSLFLWDQDFIVTRAPGYEPCIC